jgi:hypothetical protein
MSLEDYNSTESPEGWSQGAEVSKKYREAAKKAEAGIKRTQKDEKKAKKYDFLLAKFLVEMILKKKYDNLLDELFICLDSWYGTNFLLGVLSLIYLPISHEIRRFSEKPEILFQYEISWTSQDFDDKEIAEPIRLRVNAWIEDMESISQMEVSSIITKRTLGLILYDEKIRSFTSAVFKSFFLELNIHMNESKSKSYSDFILWQLEKTLANNMPELTKKWTQEGLEI